MTAKTTSEVFHDPQVVALYEAASRGDAAGVHALKDAGVGLDARGKLGITPALWATIQRDPTALQTLLDAGADPNLADDEGHPPLQWAVRYEEPAFVKSLLSHGADPDARTHLDNPVLFVAIDDGHWQYVEALLDAGADVNAIGRGGHTALHRATMANQFDKVQFLLDRGADPAAVDDTGGTAGLYVQEALVDPESDNAAAQPKARAVLEARGVKFPVARPWSRRNKMRIRDVVLDFDGTCTRVQDAAEGYLKECHRIFAQEVGEEVAKEWASALDTVRSHSPHAGWMLGGAPFGPAAADPYILAGEAAGYLIRKYRIKKPVPDLHTMAYDAAQAAFREELAEVLEALVGLGVRVSFVSNSRTKKIENRLSDLLVKNPTLRRALTVQGDAAKFRIQELSFDADVQPHEELRRLFNALPGATEAKPLDRPIYLRRGAYFETLCKVWENEPSRPASTLFCGDIWELDLAMPAALGAQVHLISRAAPYDTYEYERRAVESHGARGTISDDLRGLLERVRELNAAS